MGFIKTHQCHDDHVLVVHTQSEILSTNLKFLAINWHRGYIFFNNLISSTRIIIVHSFNLFWSIFKRKTLLPLLLDKCLFWDFHTILSLHRYTLSVRWPENNWNLFTSNLIVSTSGWESEVCKIKPRYPRQPDSGLPQKCK